MDVATASPPAIPDPEAAATPRDASGPVPVLDGTVCYIFSLLFSAPSTMANLIVDTVDENIDVAATPEAATPPNYPISDGNVHSSSTSTVVHLVDDDDDDDVAAPSPPRRALLDPVDHWEFEWIKGEDMPYIEPYTGPEPGLTFTTIHRSTPLLMFSYLFDEEIWRFMVEQTNKYAMYIRTRDPAKHRSKWSPTDTDELKAYIGMVIAMGIIKLPRMDLYWQTKYPLFTLLGIPEVMSRDRFLTISRYFHISDRVNEPRMGTPRYDKLYKVRTFHDMLSRRFQSLFNPGPEVTIDEAMIPYKGRLSFIQYMKDKPTKWGIKVWTLSDAKTGYIYATIIYTGKDVHTSGLLGDKVVCALLQGFEYTGIHVYTDSFYTNPNLLVHLHERGIYACGTVQKNKEGMPKDMAVPKVSEKRYEMGDIDWWTNDSLLFVRWKDKRMVYVLSTIHNLKDVEGHWGRVVRHQGPVPVELSCPQAVIDYIKFMRGVDRGDQLISLYNSGRRTKTWWKRIFFHSLESAVLNAHILYDQLLCTKSPLLQFKKELATALIGGRSYRMGVGGRPRRGPVERRLAIGVSHLPDFNEGGRRKDCLVCKERVRRSGGNVRRERYRSKHCCSTCNVPLCILPGRNCFKVYHTEEKYWL